MLTHSWSGRSMPGSMSSSKARFFAIACIVDNVARSGLALLLWKAPQLLLEKDGRSRLERSEAFYRNVKNGTGSVLT